MVWRRDEKGIFALMNYFLPLKGVASMHCSANVGAEVMLLYSLVYQAR